MSSKKTLFNELWLDPSLNPEFGWLKKGEDLYHGFCDVCKKSFTLGNMGRKAVVTHSKGQLHNKLIKMRATQTSLKPFLMTPNTSNSKQVETVNCDQDSSNNESVLPVPGPSSSLERNIKSVEAFCSKDDVNSAEIRWALNVVQNKLSLHSCENIGETFRDMFPDSSIASKFQLGETKCSYVINHGLAPYFQTLLKDQLRSCKDFVVCFDEAMNKVVQRGQMDLFIRFFDINDNRVHTRYYNSVFLGRATAQHLLDGFSNGIIPLSKKNLLQVSMDGPSVNLSFIKMLDDQIREDSPDGKHLVNIGVCGLHVINGAMKTGIQSVHWDLHTFLRDIFYLFNDCPARRAQFTSITGGNKFPLKHCTTRWLENVKCLERALLVLDNVSKFIVNTKTLQSKPYTIVTEHIKDKFIKCKLAFYKVISSDCEPFLRRFQSSSPLVPYLYSHLLDLLRTLLSRCVKSNKLSAANTASKLVSIDLHDAQNLLDLNKIDLGFQTFKFLQEVKSSEADALKFRKECQTLLINLIAKLLQRSPMNYKVIRGLSSLDPSVILLQPEVGCSRMKCLLEALYNANRITDGLAEKAKNQYSSLCNDAKGTLQEKFKLFGPNSDEEGTKSEKRLDDFYASILFNNPKYVELWEVVKMSLIFSHGNATVEGGFSINKSILVENQHEETIVAQRQVYDAIIDAGGRKKIPITHKMLVSVRSARRRYEEFLEAKRRIRTEEEKATAQKRKFQSEIKKLEEERKKLRLKSQAEEELIAAKIKELAKVTQ